MPLGRPRRPGTDAERAAARREQVRENVRNFRQRNRERAQSENQPESSDSDARSRRSSISRSTASSSRQALALPTEALSTSFQGLATSTQTASTSQVQIPLATRNISITSEYVGQTLKWSLGLPFRIDLGPSYSDVFMAAFQYQNLPSPDPIAESDPLEAPYFVSFVPDHGPTTTPSVEPEPASSDLQTPALTRVKICYYTWTTSVTFGAMSPDSEMLREALLSAALNLISMERNDRAMAMQAVQLQATALRKLRDGFDDYLQNKDPSKAALLSATALACSMSELLVNKSWDGFSLHLGGVGALIEHAGPASLDTQTAQHHFYGYQAVQTVFSFLHRRGTFLSRDEWINLHWRNRDSFEHPIHTLFDIVLHVPYEMEQYDKSPNRTPGTIRRQLQKLNEVALELNQWRVGLFSKYASSMHTSEAVSWLGLHDTSIDFTNDIVATSFTTYTGVRIALFSLVRQLAEDLKADDESAIPVLNYSIEEMLKWSKIACQCVEYHFASDPDVTGKVMCLFPFDMAWNSFVELGEKYERDLSTELRWCQSAAERIEATGLPVFKVRSRI